MICRILCLCLLSKVAFSSAALSDVFELESPAVSAGNAPFFEIPCMAAGGICARSVACPKGTKVAVRGLCPVQQDLGMECCRPPKTNILCKSRGGKCLSLNTFSCPRALRILDATDCGSEETCCVLR